MKEYVTGLIVVITLMSVLCPNWEKDNSKPIEIKIDFCMITLRSYKVFKKLLHEYTREHPELKISTRFVAGRPEIKMLTQVIAGTAPDISCVHYSFFPDFCQKGAFMPLREIEGFKKDDFKDFYPISLTTYSKDGKYYGIPFKGSAVCIFYNKKLFKKAGIPYPDPAGWNFEDFEKAAKATSLDLNGDGKKDTTGFMIVRDIKYWIPFFWNNSGKGWFDEKTLTCYLDRSENISTIKRIIDLGKKYEAAKLDSEIKAVSATASPFEDGKVGMIVSGPWILPKLAAAGRNGLDWDIAPMPSEKKNWKTRYAGMAFAISSRTKYPKVCLDILKFLTNKSSQGQLAVLQEDIPVRKSVASKKIINPKTSWDGKRFLDCIEHARPLENIPYFNGVQGIYAKHIELIWLEQETVEQGCKNMTKEINKYLERIRKKKKRREEYMEERK